MEGHEDTTFDPGAANPIEIPALTVDRSSELVARAASMVVQALQPTFDAIGERLDTLDARMDRLGTGGETVGDALSQAAFALACARELAAGLQRSIGVLIPLPAAPELVGEPLAEIRVTGADVAGSLSL